ncbi:MAG: metallophosphoesterase family protein [Promethearchaeota archaeon]
MTLLLIMIEIVHISDLHYGSGSEFKLNLLEGIIDYINDLNPDAVVCTGDLVHKGRPDQYAEVRAILRTINKSIPLMIVPGNHDLKNSGIVQFERYIGPRRSKLVLEDLDTLIVGLCSAKDDVSEGELGDEQLEWLARQFNENLENRIIALHHHVIAVPYSGRIHATLLDAGELIEITQLFEVDLVLMGHKHIPHAWVLGSCTFLYCGTSTSTKSRADDDPSFNLIHLNQKNLEVYLINSRNFNKQLLLRRKQGKTEFIRPRRTRIEHLINSRIFLD